MKLLMIAGTEKAGTTSLYNYLVQLPQFKGSVKKETDYFRYNNNFKKYVSENFSGSIEKDQILFEASPGYLSEADVVVDNLSKLDPSLDLHLVFLLRHPAERFISSYKFFLAKGYLPENMTLGEFLEMNLVYCETGEKTVSSISNDWFYKTFQQGFYEELLKKFDDIDRGINTYVYSYETLKNNPKFLMTSLLGNVGAEFVDFENFDFFIFNKTVNPKSRSVHLFFDKVNKNLEWFFLKFPSLKKKAKNIYSLINASEKPVDVSDSDKDAVFKAYSDQNLLDYSYRFVKP